jgi:hypothetical protein
VIEPPDQPEHGRDENDDADDGEEISHIGIMNRGTSTQGERRRLSRK